MPSLPLVNITLCNSTELYAVSGRLLFSESSNVILSHFISSNNNITNSSIDQLLISFVD